MSSYVDHDELMGRGGARTAEACGATSPNPGTCAEDESIGAGSMSSLRHERRRGGSRAASIAALRPGQAAGTTTSCGHAAEENTPLPPSHCRMAHMAILVLLARWHTSAGGQA